MLEHHREYVDSWVVELGLRTKSLGQLFNIEIGRILNEREKKLAIFYEVSVVGGIKKLVGNPDQLDVQLRIRLKSDYLLGG